MRRHKLYRWAPTVDGVFGRFMKWFSAEEEQQGNKPQISCIPARIYVCKRTIWRPNTPKALETFEVTGVSNRSQIKFHPLTTEEDTEGCIGLGNRLGTYVVEKPEEGGSPIAKIAIFEARKAHADFMAAFDGVSEWELEIVEYTP